MEGLAREVIAPLLALILIAAVLLTAATDLTKHLINLFIRYYREREK